MVRFNVRSGLGRVCDRLQEGTQSILVICIPVREAANRKPPSPQLPRAEFPSIPNFPTFSPASPSFPEPYTHEVADAGARNPVSESAEREPEACLNLKAAHGVQDAGLTGEGSDGSRIRFSGIELFSGTHQTLQGCRILGFRPERTSWTVQKPL